MSFYFADQTYEQLKEYSGKNAVIILPVGTIEEHGRHLPVETDTTIAREISRLIGENISKEIPLLVMPVLWTGYSPKAMNKWPGNMNVRPLIFIELVKDVIGSIINSGFRKIVLIDCHGQHAPFLNTACKMIADEYNVYAAVTSPLVFSAKEFNEIRKSQRGGVLHACEWETSLMLKFSDYVDMSKATDIDINKYQSEFVSGDSAMGGQKVVWSTWGLQESKTGVYGDPTVASTETADVIIEAVIKNYRKFLKEYYNKT